MRWFTVKHYHMSRLIRRYEVPMQLITEEPGGYDPESGIYRKSKPVLSDFRGAVMPVPERVVYESGGRYTREDRVIYSTWGLPIKSKIVYRNAIYSVEDAADYTEYSDFFQYVVRRVSAFDGLPGDPEYDNQPLA